MGLSEAKITTLNCQSIYLEEYGIDINQIDELKIEKEKLKKVLEDDTNILTKLTKNDKKLNDEESKDDDPELVLTK